jgi:lipopolysaccharide transport system ATP-binding protein
MSSDLAISARGLGKCYSLFERPEDRLKQMLSFGRRKYYREFWAVKDVGLDVYRGETVGIIGRNGSGKSTLLQMICGTLTPTSGELRVNGRIAALLELGAGFNPEFTGRENVFMNASILGVERTEIERRFDSIAAFADIGRFIEQPIKTYSSGMHVRLAFAVAAHVDAEILVVDEALAVGDFVFQQKCMRYLREFMKSGTVLFVSHDIAAVTNLCDRVLWLEQGRVLLSGAAKDICEAYLAAGQEAQQGGGGEAGKPARNTYRTKRSGVIVDQRLKYINASALRNDIEVFRFDPDAKSFGKGGATIQDVQLLDEQGRTLSWIVGGETITLSVKAIANQTIARPIIGFFIKDRLGQNLFGDNTYLSYRDSPVAVQQRGTLQARFVFQMPLLPPGRYSVCAAIAEGTQENHVQHHWIHDALIFESHARPMHVAGLVGLPMIDVLLTTQGDSAGVDNDSKVVMSAANT